MKIIITERQFDLLEQQLGLFDDEELPMSDEFDDEELPMSDEFDDEELPMFDNEEEEFQISDESDEENIPEITYANALHKPDFNFVFFSGVKGDLPSEGKIKLINVRALNSPREREDDIIIDVNEFTNSKFGYKISDTQPEVRNIKSFDVTTPKVNSTLNPDTINLKFMNVIFKCLKNIYGNTINWSKGGGRGPGGRGGVINIYTINTILKNENLITSNFPGGDWSILNYFDTNPKVRDYLMRKYKKDTKISIKTNDNLNSWCKWIEDNQKNFFTKGIVLNKLVELNTTSYISGYHNEKTVYNYLLNIISNNPELMIEDPKKPGDSSDRKGVDFSIINTSTGLESKFQAKPLVGYNVNGKEHIVNSYNVKNLEKKGVEYFIFSSRDTNDKDIIIFEKREGEIISDKNIVVFNYPPISPEELLKEL